MALWALCGALPFLTLAYQICAKQAARDLAAKLGAEVGKVETVLRRYFDKNPECRTQVENPRRGEPRHVYRVAEVWPELVKAWRRWNITTGD